MSASLQAVGCCFLLLNFHFLLASEPPKIEDVLQAVQKMVSYYEDKHKEMNLDGIYGLRVLEGEGVLRID